MKRRGFFAALAGLVASPFVAAAKPDPLDGLVEAAEALDAAPVPEASRMLWSTDAIVRRIHQHQEFGNNVNRAYMDNLWLTSNPVIVVDTDKLDPVDWPILPGKVVRAEPQG